ncbi:MULTISPECIES: molybdenum cofactor biosynthesis protein [Cohnella]|uniref:molybdenum cofactor biosynthesis protein n=1 Tax=Cohnella TaxID=329857 RepID=UPI0009B9D5A6|nr:MULTISPECIES: molybdenum cofactor biosynthesis protein MoaE [Cohnella]MBN2984945.1 molybdenum cofactor biosynthesis protein MoaE [Cohnella algarum]
MEQSIRWRVSLFAGLAERFDARMLILESETSEMTVRDLKRTISEKYPDHADLVAISFMARNQEFAADDARITSEDELALLPPVSGGEDAGSRDESDVARTSERYAILQDKLEPDAVLSLVAHPDHGASVVFVGTTREWTAGQRTVLLEYEAYVPMAVREMRRIGDEIGERWPGTLCAIHHRIGPVGIGEASVVIAVSSPHRAHGYEASRFAIERLKQTVPIWKKEVYEDGTEWKGHQTGPWNPLARPEPAEPPANGF